MSAYHAPNHNRLLDLERHIHHQKPAVGTSRKRIEEKSAQPKHSLSRSNSQRVNKLQDVSYQQQPTISEEYLARQSKRNKPQHSVAESFSPPRATRQKNRPMPRKGLSRSYRQLATQMGKYYAPGNHHKQMPNTDLPVITPPINQPVINKVAETETPVPSQHDIPASTSATTLPPLEPKWKELALSIRQTKPVISNSLSESNHSDSVFNIPSAQQIPDRTMLQKGAEDDILRENSQQDKDSPLKNSSAVPVTIDVIPVAITSNQIKPATTLFTQDLEMTTANKIEQSLLDDTTEIEEEPTSDSTHANNASVVTQDNLNYGKRPEHPISIVDNSRSKNRILQFYQGACEPQILRCFTHLQNKIYHFRENLVEK